ncbi:putative acyl-CoA binding protein [Leishmania major strain Friedlin]|uniref:Putative acyl-CoA binding protein n=1 Tax=Leishmania major TaxID=5664 RepID=Q4Q2T5_LEIMA|nr:putative acyl-CoA binding protein [Leishmania major strain Friedlin]CAG9582137.1 acyl-CoA_binding_protein_-_putative [Leishmania major strain Friedlin]CAJ07980.1 putative acyl-CoA binding protein [Leishmania major strain Friedlin]|eukprot:XP_001686363.1 putative acyl-CoA binding protein [Leishmania major strain Friedlin]
MSAEEFERYTKSVSDLRSNLSIPQKIEMYGLWCVATRGKCTLKQPSRANMVEYGKWAAWKKYEPLGQQKARELFIEKAKTIVAKYPSKL